MFVAFATEEELKAHYIQRHSARMPRWDGSRARPLLLDFDHRRGGGGGGNVTFRVASRGGRGGGSRGAGGGSRGALAVGAAGARAAEAFPSLGSSSAAASSAAMADEYGGGGFTMIDDNPALSNLDHPVLREEAPQGSGRQRQQQHQQQQQQRCASERLVWSQDARNALPLHCFSTQLGSRRVMLCTARRACCITARNHPAVHLYCSPRHLRDTWPCYGGNFIKPFSFQVCSTLPRAMIGCVHRWLTGAWAGRSGGPGGPVEEFPSLAAAAAAASGPSASGGSFSAPPGGAATRLFKLVKVTVNCPCGRRSQSLAIREGESAGSLACDRQCAADARQRQLASAFGVGDPANHVSYCEWREFSPVVDLFIRACERTPADVAALRRGSYFAECSRSAQP